MVATSADPTALASARVLAARLAARASRLAEALPVTAAPDAVCRVERALAEAGHALDVAAVAAGLVRTGGGDAR